jgi:hypothetical protein
MKTQTPATVGRHFYQFYRGKEEVFRTAVPFLRLGLENHEACLWVVSQGIGILEAIEALQRELDLTRYIESGQLLILPAERWYMDRGRFSKRKVLERTKQLIEEKGRLGFSSFRRVWDAGWVQPEDWTEVQSYESEVHDWIQTTGVLLALCLYPTQGWNDMQRQDVMDRHDTVFLSKL